jgi:hypothetical protein
MNVSSGFALIRPQPAVRNVLNAVGMGCNHFASVIRHNLYKVQNLIGILVLGILLAREPWHYK